jgi:hypothetical protein
LIGIWIPSWILSNKFYKSILLTIKLSNFSEIIFIILSNLKKNNYLDDFTLNFFNSITIVSFLLAPILNKIVQNFFKKSFKNIQSNLKNNNYDVVIVGFNKALLPIRKMLEENEINYVIIEKNLSKINLAKNYNFHIVYGDMFNNQMLSILNFHWNTVVFINFSIMAHHIPNLINFRKKFHTTKLLALANLESDSLAQRFNIDIINNPYLDQSIHIGKTILQSFNGNWNDNDLEIYVENFKKIWQDNEKDV